MHATIQKGYVPSTRCFSPFQTDDGVIVFSLELLTATDSTVVLNLNVTFEKRTVVHLCAAFSPLLSFFISSADSQCPW